MQKRFFIIYMTCRHSLGSWLYRVVPCNYSETVVLPPFKKGGQANML